MVAISYQFNINKEIILKESKEILKLKSTIIKINFFLVGINKISELTEEKSVKLKVNWYYAIWTTERKIGNNNSEKYGHHWAHQHIINGSTRKKIDKKEKVYK